MAIPTAAAAAATTTTALLIVRRLVGYLVESLDIPTGSIVTPCYCYPLLLLPLLLLSLLLLPLITPCCYCPLLLLLLLLLSPVIIAPCCYLFIYSLSHSHSLLTLFSPTLPPSSLFSPSPHLSLTLFSLPPLPPFSLPPSLISPLFSLPPLPPFFSLFSPPPLFSSLSEFLLFLRSSHYAPLDLALRECEKRKPPLYLEMIYVLGKMGNTREALALLLREVTPLDGSNNIYP